MADEDTNKATETNEQHMSRLDRDSAYRIAALDSAVNRAAQDGGLTGEIDVLAMAEAYYAWLRGNIDVERPTVEKLKHWKLGK